MRKLLIDNQKIRTVGIKGVVIILTLGFYFTPIFLSINYFSFKQNTFVLLEDFNEEHGRTGKTAVKTLDGFMLCLVDLLANSKVKTQFFVHKKLTHNLQAFWLEVTTPPPEFSSLA